MHSNCTISVKVQRGSLNFAMGTRFRALFLLFLPLNP